MDFRICGDVLVQKLEDLAKNNGVTVHKIISDALNHYVYLAEISSKNRYAELLLIINADCDDGVLHLPLPCNGPRWPDLRLVDDGQKR